MLKWSDDHNNKIILTEFDKNMLVICDGSLESVFFEDQDTFVILDFISSCQYGKSKQQ